MHENMPHPQFNPLDNKLKKTFSNLLLFIVFSDEYLIIIHVLS